MAPENCGENGGVEGPGNSMEAPGRPAPGASCTGPCACGSIRLLRICAIAKPGAIATPRSIPATMARRQSHLGAHPHMPYFLEENRGNFKPQESSPEASVSGAQGTETRTRSSHGISPSRLLVRRKRPIIVIRMRRGDATSHLAAFLRPEMEKP